MATIMECGHTANGIRIRDGERIDCCVICGGKASETPAPPVDLSGRVARCGYYGSIPKGRLHEGPCKRGEPCLCERPSTTDHLAFFEHTPDRDYDRFYCGCWGWD